MNKELLVKEAYEGYIEFAEDENIIVIDLNGFDYLDECQDEDGELKLELITELNKMLIDLFEQNEYDIYEDFYPFNGRFENVKVDTVVAIKK